MGTLRGFPNPPALWLRRAKPGYANAIMGNGNPERLGTCQPALPPPRCARPRQTLGPYPPPPRCARPRQTLGHYPPPTTPLATLGLPRSGGAARGASEGREGEGVEVQVPKHRRSRWTKPGYANAISLLTSLKLLDRAGGVTFGSAFRNTFDGLRPGHDTGEVGILVRVEGTMVLTIRMPLEAALGLLLLPLLPKNFLLSFLGCVFRARSHAWSTNAACGRRRIHRDRRRRHHHHRIHRDRRRHHHRSHRGRRHRPCARALR
jgi:hypothetical protein